MYTEIVRRRGHEICPLLFFLPMTETIDKIKAMLEPLLEGTDIFVTDIRIKPTNNIKIFLDADEGLSVEKSAKTNRKLYYLIEESGMFPDGDYSLEVSSPGIDEPLTSHRQYLKNIGRTVAVTVGGEEELEMIGVLRAVDEIGLLLEMTDKKKKTKTEAAIPHENIKKIVVQIVF